MRKRLYPLWLLLASLCMMLTLSACTVDLVDTDTEEADQAPHYTKQLVVVYSKNDVLIARGELSDTDIYSLSLADMTDDSTPQVGDVLEIEYSGILESFPAQFGTIYSQTLLEQGESTTDTGVVLAMDQDGILTVEFTSESGEVSQKSLSMEYDSANWFDEASPYVGAVVQVTSSGDVIYCITVVE